MLSHMVTNEDMFKKALHKPDIVLLTLLLTVIIIYEIQNLFVNLFGSQIVSFLTKNVGHFNVTFINLKTLLQKATVLPNLFS